MPCSGTPCLLALLLSVLVAVPAGGHTLTLRYQETLTWPSKETTHSEVSYTITPEETVIQRMGEEVAIHYRKLTLTRTQGDRSVEYPLAPPGTGQHHPTSLQDGLMRRVAVYRLGDLRAGLRIGDIPTVERSIWFGAGLALSGSASAPSVTSFGQRFSERRIQCWVSKENALYDAVAAIARERRAVVRANPLLLQLDLSNLTLPLDGLPLRLREQREGAVSLLEWRSP